MPIIIDPAAMLTALGGFENDATASMVAAALNQPDAAREVAALLRGQLADGKVMESRPGRYRASGAGGEYAAVLSLDDDRKTVARCPDGKLLPVNPAYMIGAKVGDVAQVMLGEDGQALVTCVVRRAGREVVGVVNFRAGGAVLVPDNRREGTYTVLSFYPRFHQEYQAGDRVIGTLVVDPTGQGGVHLTRVLGRMTPEVADFTYVCLGHDLPGEFPPEVLALASTFGANPSENDYQGREDLRQKLVFTIDPATAKDFDDAISLEADGKGGWILGVHIADVSHYVRHGSVVDAEAARRGTSCYLINRVIPMLPEAISNGLCSLVPRQDRFCLSAFLTLDSKLTLKHTRIAETVIHSKHRLTYEEAMAILENKDTDGTWPADLRQVVQDTGRIAQGLRRLREKAGALNLYSVEHNFRLDVEGNPIEAIREGSDESHQLIEECMLLANRAVAAWIDSKGLPCVYRLHEEPDPERLKQFAMVLEAYGKDSTGLQNRFGLQKLLVMLKREPPAARLVLNYLLLRSFKKASYGIENIGHYALAFSHYAHFTSPIRRYPDLLVHRLAKLALKLDGYKDVECRPMYLDALAKQSSFLEQRAEGAERDLHHRKAARYLSARIGQVFAGVVTTASPAGLMVQMMETGMDGLIPLRELKDDFYTFDAERLSLLGRHSGRVRGVGNEIDVLVVAVDIDRADVVLGLPDHERGPRSAADQADRDAHRLRDDRDNVKRKPAAAPAPVPTPKPARIAPAEAARERKRAEKAQRLAEKGQARREARAEKGNKKKR